MADDAPVLTIPAFSLVALVGASGCGKSTFAARHFKPTEVVSSDHCRGVVSDDDTDQSASREAFDLLHHIVGVRLRRGRLTVVDATNVRPEARRQLLDLARAHDALAVAIVFDLPERECIARNAGRAGRDFGPHVVRTHCRELRASLPRLRSEGFRYVHVLAGTEAAERSRVERTPLWTDRRGDAGPFDIIGDVHGCGDELETLLDRLGYRRAGGPEAPFSHPAGRKAVFLGDLVDRGPRVVDVVNLVMAMVEAGAALCVPGNHDIKLLRHLQGRAVRITHGLDATLAQLEALPEPARAQFAGRYVSFIDGLVSHYLLDGGRLVVAHAGMKREYQGRASGRVREFALYGDTTGETDEFGLPVRLDWAASYRGDAAVVYGHTPTPEAEWLNGTMNIDTGCVFGGKLTALRWPERALVSVPARAAYARPARPLPAPGAPAIPLQWRHDDLLDLADIHGKRVIETRLARAVTIPAEHAAAALEVMSRFAIDPRWLIYLPPTMSPGATSKRPDTLEHPAEVFGYFAENGVGRVLCEEKHMGSRAVIVACRDEAAARRRFGATERLGACFTRTGRGFFEGRTLEEELLGRVRGAAAAARLWEELATDWVCLDAEVLPWNAKARTLVAGLYAPVGAAGASTLSAARAAADLARQRGVDVGDLPERLARSDDAVQRYRAAYRRYCWEVEGLAGVRVAPFALLASEGRAHADRDHGWHLALLDRLAQADPRTFTRTERLEVDPADAASAAAGVAWWEERTAGGAEGMVVKPLAGVVAGARGLVQPAVKCRGREYLRIIYGPTYLEPENLERLRARALGHKRSLAVREFALGVEALERFVRGEPLRRVHECVFGVLALESEPIDPRL